MTTKNTSLFQNPNHNAYHRPSLRQPSIYPSPQPTMTLPRSSINAIRSNLDRAVSTKDPAAIATALDVPLLKANVVGSPSTSGDGSSSSGSVHREQLKVDGVDWSNVLNYLLDVHLAIVSVSAYVMSGPIQHMHRKINWTLEKRCLVPSKGWLQNFREC